MLSDTNRISNVFFVVVTKRKLRAKIYFDSFMVFMIGFRGKEAIGSRVNYVILSFNQCFQGPVALLKRVLIATTQPASVRLNLN